MSSVEQAKQKFPKKDDAVVSYGTAGFRMR